MSHSFRCTHNLEIIPHIANRVIVMRFGRIVDISSINSVSSLNTSVDKWLPFFAEGSSCEL